MKSNIPLGKKIIVVTGPESSGKTTLVNRLKTDCGVPVVSEFSRTYLENNGATYDFTDLKTIGKCQNIQESEAHNKYPLVICDTDIITIDIWAQEVFDKSIDLPNNNSNLKHYLLCKPDIPWVADSFRENPNDRDRLFQLYLGYLNERGLSYDILDNVKRQNWSIVNI